MTKILNIKNRKLIIIITTILYLSSIGMIVLAEFASQKPNNHNAEEIENLVLFPPKNYTGSFLKEGASSEINQDINVVDISHKMNLQMKSTYSQKRFETNIICCIDGKCKSLVDQNLPKISLTCNQLPGYSVSLTAYVTSAGIMLGYSRNYKVTTYFTDSGGILKAYWT